MNDEILKAVSGILNGQTDYIKTSMYLICGLALLGTIMKLQYTVSGDFKDGKGIKFQPASECIPKEDESFIGAANNTSV